MKIAPLAEVKTKFSEYVNESHKGTVIVTKNGKATAVILGIHDDDELERIILSNSKRFISMMKASEKRILSKKVKTHEQMWEEIEK